MNWNSDRSVIANGRAAQVCRERCLSWDTQRGTNVLAIQGLNSSLDDDDFVLSQFTLGGNLFDVNLPGDYNNDGTVNAADYTKWRDNLGAPAGSLQNDIDGGAIGAAQYATWKAQFGQTALLGTLAATAPEPSSFWLLGIGVLLQWVSRPLRNAHQSVQKD